MSETVKSSAMLVTTNQYIEKLKSFAATVQIDFTDYQKTCVVNAVRAINPILLASAYRWDDFAVDNIVTVLQQTAFLNLNPSAVPRECFFIVRKNWDNKNKVYLPPTLEFGVEGAGNDIILREFGRDVKDIKSYIVYEGDEFIPGNFDGWDVVLPKYRRMFKTNKPEKAVYLIKKANGEIDVQYADLDDVKKSLLANAKQNGADDKFLRELNRMSLYELLNDEKWLNYTFKKAYNNNTYETPLFNPSYTSPISMFNMIERKLRNHATRKYPKNFNNKAISELYEETFDEKQIVAEQITAEERLQLSTTEFEKGNSKETIITTPTTPPTTTAVPKPEDTRPKIEVKVEKTEKEPTAEKKEPVVEPTLTKEEVTEKETPPTVSDTDEPDWDK
jgi:hypothetical protein